MTNAYASLPIEMEESACIDGCNIYQLFWKIMFPLVKPTVAAIALFTFLSSWNELMFAMTFISEPKWKTLTIGLQSLSGMFYTEWGPIGAGMDSSNSTCSDYLFVAEQTGTKCAYYGRSERMRT